MSTTLAAPTGGAASPSGELRATGTLDIKDSRTDKSYSVQIVQGGVEGDTATRAMDLRQIKTSPDEFGLMTYDPAFMNTASCKSAITFIDGDKGILRYRGYPDRAARRESRPFSRSRGCCATASCPTQTEYDSWVHDITYHTYVHENIKTFLQGFRYDAHPMSMLCSTVAALSSFYPEAKNIHDPEQRNISIIRLLAKLPTLAAFCYRHIKGLPFIYPDNDLSYVENFLSMVARMSEPKYEANPVFVNALEILFILHADHEQNCSTSAVRAVGIVARRSVLGDRGRRRGAVRPAARRRERAGAPHDQARSATRRTSRRSSTSVKGGKGSRLMGFGHRVYKSYDPRAKIVKKLADEVFKQVGVDKDLEIALKLERSRAARRLLRLAQALSERRLLHGADLSVDGVPDRLLHRAVRRRAHRGLARAVGRDAATTRSRRSRGRGRSTRATASGRSSRGCRTGFRPPRRTR